MKNKKHVSAWFLSHKFTMNILLVHFPGSLNPCSLVFENGANVFFGASNLFFVSNRRVCVSFEVAYH